VITTTAARLAALARQLDRLAGMDDTRTRTPAATAVDRAAFEANWIKMFEQWTSGLSEAEADAEARRWLALMEQAV